MENKIKTACWIAKNVREIWFHSPLIAKNFKPGQFVVVLTGENSERIPLTIVDTSDNHVCLIVQDVGLSTNILCNLNAGDKIENVAGPLGEASKIENFGKVVCVAGGIGAAPLKPVATALKNAGNSLTIIEGVRSKEYLILSDELDYISDEFILTSDDGSVGEKSLVTGPLQHIIDTQAKPDLVYAVGPPVMMEAVSNITKPNSIPLIVSLNPIMVDGTGMCGSCRVEVAGETFFACVDGPEFDGNEVDYKLLINRLKMYSEEEKNIRVKHNCCGSENGCSKN